MKTKLLLALLVSTALGFAQHPIAGYYGYINDDFGTTDGTGVRSYNLVTSAVPLDHSATGANLTWNFTQLSPSGFSHYHNVEPTVTQTAQYPGTTRIVENEVTVNSVTSMARTFLNGWAITGVENNEFSINYTDNGAFSTAPLDYGVTHSESIAGSYSYDGYEGTFTGTISGAVDAYGTLNLNNAGFGSTSDAVTRLKIVQSLSLQYPGFGTVGTVVFTSYHYYREGDLYPFFTSKTSDFDIPILAIDEEQTVLEAAAPAFLGLPAVETPALRIAPNPAKNFVLIQAGDNVSIQAVTVYDMNGRTVQSEKPNNNAIDVSTLNSGVYFVRIKTDSGAVTKKIVKQ